MTTLFLHGLGSTPGGIKATFLNDHVHTVFNPALPDGDFDEAVEHDPCCEAVGDRADDVARVSSKASLCLFRVLLAAKVTQ
jgi:hypothetical protein